VDLEQETASPDELINAVDEKISAVRTQSLDFSFNELADMHADGELIIDPEFQRMFRWSEGGQARFIESLLLELPIPPIFLIEREDRVYELIDGLQRISSFLHFRGQLKLDGETLAPLVLSDCDIVTELNGKTHADLPRALEIKLKRSYIRAEILRKESDHRLRYYMFKRLNTGGERLAEQEVRNATIRLLSEDFNNFLITLSRNEDFTVTIGAITGNAKKRKFDQELVLRFFSFKNAGHLYKHDIGDFLTDYLEAVSDDSSEVHFDYEEERGIFDKTFRAIRRIGDILDYGPRVFGTMGRNGQPKSQFSVYHYEGITLGLQRVIARVDLENETHLNALAEVVRVGKADPAFLKATGGGKNERNALKARIDYFGTRFEGAID
jgi:hypothetical protein